MSAHMMGVSLHSASPARRPLFQTRLLSFRVASVSRSRHRASRVSVGVPDIWARANLRFLAARVSSAVLALAMFLGMASPGFAQQGAPIPNGLTNWWRGELNAVDTQGSMNGTILGGAGYTSPGKV